MTTKNHQIKVGGMPVAVVRKDIKHLHLAVYPPNGRVRVAVPLRLDDEEVRVQGVHGSIHAAVASAPGRAESGSAES